MNSLAAISCGTDLGLLQAQGRRPARPVDIFPSQLAEFRQPGYLKLQSNIFDHVKELAVAGPVVMQRPFTLHKSPPAVYHHPVHIHGLQCFQILFQVLRLGNLVTVIDCVELPANNQILHTDVTEWSNFKWKAVSKKFCI